MVDDWKWVMSADESMISCMGFFGRKYYYSGRERNRLQPHQIQSMQQGGVGDMMVWSCITYFCPGDICWINGSLDSEFDLVVHWRRENMYGE